MKLGALNVAIKAAETVKVRFTFGEVPVQKGGLMDALKTHFTGGKAQETNLKLNANNCLEWEVLPGGD